jgi:hypothetical protein
MPCGKPSNRYCRKSRPIRKVVVRRFRIGPPSAASSSCCERAARGGSCPRNLPVTAGPLAGADSGTGRGGRVGATAHHTDQLAWRRGRRRLESGERRYPERPGQKGASRPARTGSTGANPAPSTTWLSIGTAFPWPFTSRRPMSTTRPTCCPWSTRFPQSLALGEARSSSQAPRQAARRHGARFLGAATCPAGPRHHNALGAAGDRLQRATRTVPLGGGADALLAP